MRIYDRVDNLLRVTRPLLLLVMVVCWAVPAVGTLENAFRGWDGSYLLAATVLVGMEAILSERLRVSRRIRGDDIRPYRLAELGLLAVGIRLLPYLWRGWDTLWTDLARWSTDYVSILTIEYGLGLAWCLGLWWVVTWSIRDLDSLEVPAPTDERPPAYYEDARQGLKPQAEGQEALDRLRGRFLWGGAVMLLLAITSRVNVADLLAFDPGTLAGPLLNGLVYFATGLFLLSQAQLALLRLGAWGTGVEVADAVPRRWLASSGVFVLLVMVLAALLPTRYALGLLDVLRVLLGLVVLIVVTVLNAILWLYLYLLALFLSLFGVGGTTGPPPTPPPLPTPAAPPVQPIGEVVSLDAWVQSVIFWVVVAVVAGYTVYHFARTRRHLLTPLLRWRWVQSLLRWLAGLRRGLGHLAGQARRLRLPTLPSPGDLSIPVPAAPRGFLSLSRLSPRELVLYFYRSIVQRAGKRGLPRQPSQTPYEYSAALRDRLPEAQEELDDLTAAFVEARYSAHPVDQDRATGVRRVWEAVKRAVRQI